MNFSQPEQPTLYNHSVGEGRPLGGATLDQPHSRWLEVAMVLDWKSTDLYPLVNVYVAMERSTIFNGKTHYFYGHFQ